MDENEDLLEAGVRELAEETGLSVPTTSLRTLCAWESVYPTTLELCLLAGEVKGHMFVTFLTGTVAQDELSQLRLQDAECDMCAWVPLSELAMLHGETDIGMQLRDLDLPTDTMCWSVADGNSAEGIVEHEHMADLISIELNLAQLHGIYPNEIGEGIGQGHLFFNCCFT